MTDNVRSDLARKREGKSHKSVDSNDESIRVNRSERACAPVYVSGNPRPGLASRRILPGTGDLLEESAAFNVDRLQRCDCPADSERDYDYEHEGMRRRTERLRDFSR